MDHKLIEAILVALLAISEVLAFIPQVKANSIFQLLVNGAQAAKDFFSKQD